MTAAAEKKRHPIIELMESEEARLTISEMLPEGQTYKRVLREFYLAAADNPKILECEPASIVRAVSRAVSWDLVIGVTAFLVPRKDKTSDPMPKLRAQQGYRGKIELMVRHRAARLVDAQCVYSNEVFKYQQGTNPFIEHHPIMDPQKRGELIGAYAYAKITAFEVKIIVMSAEEVDEIRQQYSMQWKDKWEKGVKVAIELREIPWYLLARCVHRLSKQIPMTPKLAAMMTDDDDDDGLQVAGAGQVHPIDAQVQAQAAPVSTPTPVAPEQRAIGAGPVQPIQTSKLREGVPVHAQFTEEELDQLRFVDDDDTDDEGVPRHGHKPEF